MGSTGLYEFRRGQDPSSEPRFEFLPPTIANECAFVVRYENVAPISNMSLEYERIP